MSSITRLVFGFIMVLSLTGCSDNPTNVFQGYVEGEYIHVASPISGTLDTLSVIRGQKITADSPLFALDHDFEQAAVNEARHGLQQAQDNLANLEKGQRPSEIASVQARLEQAIAGSVLAKIEYKRRVRLIAEKTISQEELDRTKSDYDQKSQYVREIQSELTTAKLGARSDEVRAATAETLQAQAKLDQALWNFNQKTLKAPSPGLIFDTLYRVGEWVSAGQPVVSLLPPENVEIRFFIPETLIGTLENGQEVIVTYDGTDKPVPTKIYYISPSAEYTPPVIYSSESRAKLVFMIKARPSLEDAVRLHPGQPVDVTIPSLAP
ncbi:MAG: HlyD family efflux transporter periplasmic adaptor subunit [Pseudodesulfovibrio sp.]|nr:HlyD family efflux transporter periplasmic adaptor subunit [Pseudodesulfovibrio sp.]